MIGATFSSTHYQEYKETGNKNIFEEVIEKMVLEGVAGMNESTLRAIKDMPKDKKRMAILRLLMESSSSHIQMFQKIKGLVNKDISRLEHIKDIILLLRDYVKVGDVEKKKFGEVMTPLELVKEMLNTLPEETWSNPNLKILDPANGTGPYPMVAIYKLMNGLAEWEPDIEKRYKHIVENMIYACELQPKNTFLYLCAIDPFDQYNVNVYTGSFLDEGFDYHMKNVWGVDKFDIVFGNPPFNSENTGDFQTKDLYDLFVIKSMSLSDIIVMVTPARWMVKSDKFEFRNKVLNYGLKYLFFIKDISYFGGTNISGGISYFLMFRGYNGFTSYNGVDVDMKSQVSRYGFISQNSSETFFNSIMEKVSNLEKIRNFNPKSYFGLKTNHREVCDSGIKTYYSDRNGGRINLKNDGNSYYGYLPFNSIKDSKGLLHKYKVLTPSAYGYKTKSGDFYHRLGKMFISGPNEICTESFVFFDFETREECENFIEYMKTDIVKFLISIKKVKQDVTSKIFEFVPSIDFRNKINNEIVNQLFGLTEGEVSYLKSLNL